MLTHRLVRPFKLAVVVCVSAPVGLALAEPLATEESVYVPADPLERASDRPDGWSYNLKLAANMNVASNRDVVGQLNGNSLLFGASAITSAGYIRGKHQLLNNLSLSEAWSRTPVLDRFVKSNDSLELQSIYNYFVNEVTGPFARVALETILFETERVTPTDVTYVREGVPTETVTTSSLRLSDSLQPLTISESLGWFVQPLRSEPLNIMGRAGLGGRHTFAEGARAISDDADTTGMVPYQVLSDVHQAGAELFAGLDGKDVGGRLVYSAGVSVLFPLLNNDDADRSVLELTRVALAGSLGMNAMSWLSVNYQLKVVRDVQLIDAVQVQNSLLISLQYTRSSSDDAAAEEERAAAEENAAEEARVAELEERLAAAEQRAQAAEAQLESTPQPAPAETTPIVPGGDAPVVPQGRTPMVPADGTTAPVLDPTPRLEPPEGPQQGAPAAQP